MSWEIYQSLHNNILIYVLLASALITAALAHWVDTSVILAVVVANAIVGFSLDYDNIGSKNKSLLMASAKGTAVVIE